MDSRVTVRFYTVVPMEPGQASFEACLKKIMGIGADVARKLEDATVQAMGFTQDGTRISGDLIRLQDENLPSLVESMGNKPKKLPLKTGAGLGHHAAFIYDTSIRTLTWQVARNGISLGLFNAFISKICDDCPPFSFQPVIKASELKQLNSMSPKTFLIKVADPAKLDAVEDTQKRLKSSLKNLRSLADGVYIKVQIGLGNAHGELSKNNLQNWVSWLLEQRDLKKGGVRTIKIIGKDVTEDDVPLDFIRAQVGEMKKLSLGGTSDPAENYKKRAAFLTECFDKHFDELKTFTPS